MDAPVWNRMMELRRVRYNATRYSRLVTTIDWRRRRSLDGVSFRAVCRSTGCGKTVSPWEFFLQFPQQSLGISRL